MGVIHDLMAEDPMVVAAMPTCCDCMQSCSMSVCLTMTRLLLLFFLRFSAPTRDHDRRHRRTILPPSWPYPSSVSSPFLRIKPAFRFRSTEFTLLVTYRTVCTFYLITFLLSPVSALFSYPCPDKALFYFFTCG
jgi:hypothetical protein